MTDFVTNTRVDSQPAFEDACRKSPAPDLIRLVLAVTDLVLRLKANWMGDPSRVPSRAHNAALSQPDTPDLGRSS